MEGPVFSRDQGYLPLVDLLLTVQAKTSTSISLSVGRLTKRPIGVSPGLQELFAESEEPTAYMECGWIDVHYPCHEGPKVLIRMNIPAEYHPRERLLDLISELFALLSIPAHERYAAYYFALDKQSCILYADDPGGTPDKFYV
jgi:hypothetical protein